MKDTRLRTVRQRVWYFLIILAIVLFACFVWKINQTEKTQLAVRSGQTFEKAKVVEILQDNLQADGSRVGEQKVRVQMKTGVRKGEMLDITSSSGFLFGAPCTVGMKVIVMQSVAGSTTIASVYAQDREWVVYAFAGLYLLSLILIGGKQGLKGCLATVYKGNIIKNLIMDCQSYTKYRPNETTGGIFVSWRRKEELPTGA